MSERWRLINRARSRTRACGEHSFRVLQQLSGFTKVRYRGLAKNLARAQTMFALANLYQLSRHLLLLGEKWVSCCENPNRAPLDRPTARNYWPHRGLFH